MTDKVISKITVNRLVSDIKEVRKSDLSKDGIYYIHDETNMLVGHALIIGPEDTPYAYGNFLFKLDFPYDYPHTPPKLTYLTNDGYTRFHPNYYKDGRVCISMLNTWKGEQWTGCITIKATLLVLCSLLTNDPLLNEPGISNTHKDMTPYNKIITYKTYDTAIYRILNKEILPKECYIFYDIIVNKFMENYDKIIEGLNSKTSLNNEVVNTGCYNLTIKCCYNKIFSQIKSYRDKHKNIVNTINV